MKKVFILSLLIIFIVVATAVGQEQHGPRIAVQELRYDLGRVKQGREASHTFRITNAGSGTLVIERVQTG